MTVVSLAIGLLVAAGAVFVMLFRRRPSLLAFSAVYFLYFSFGPAVLFYAGGEIYRGTVVEYIPSALLGFSLALAGWALADLLWLHPKLDAGQVWGRPLAGEDRWSSWTYETLAWLGTFYGLGMAAVVLANGEGGDKLSAIVAAGPFHYRYLLLMALILCWSTGLWDSGRASAKRLVVLAWGSFIIYCLVTAERDFTLVAYAVAAHAYVGRRGRRSGALLGAVGLGAVAVGSVIFVLRAGEGLTLASVLNQGSTLFVDTFVQNWMASGAPYPENSWFAAFTRTDASELGTLSQWLAAVFTGNTESSSAYGFSLSAEASMNAGLGGIFGVYFVLGTVQMFLARKGVSAAIWSGSSAAFMYVVLYAIRGEMYSLVTAAMTIAALGVIFRVGQRAQSPGSTSLARVARDVPHDATRPRAR